MAWNHNTQSEFFPILVAMWTWTSHLSFWRLSFLLGEKKESSNICVTQQMLRWSNEMVNVNKIYKLKLSANIFKVCSMRHKWSFQMSHGKANVFLAMWDCQVACSHSWRVSIAVWQMAPAFSDLSQWSVLWSLSGIQELGVAGLPGWGVTCWLWADVDWGWRSSESLD